MTEDRRPTVGEYRVGISFNPSGDELVNRIKRQAADLIDTISTIVDGTMTGTKERAELKELAMRAVEEGAMWAVKAATKQEG
jgi:hypothetical protein